MQPKYTAAQWEQVSPAFRGLAVGTVEMAKAVLVDGVRPSDLARESDVSRQLVYAAVQRVRKILEEHQAQELVPVMVGSRLSWPSRFGKWQRLMTSQQARGRPARNEQE